MFYLQQGTRASLNLGADNSVLAEQLSRERDHSQELNNRLTKIGNELTEANKRESDARRDAGQKEKDLELHYCNISLMLRRMQGFGHYKPAYLPKTTVSPSFR